MAQVSIQNSHVKARVTQIRSFLRDESGQNLIEYALIACMIGFGAVLAMTNLRSVIASLFAKIGNVITNTL